MNYLSRLENQATFRMKGDDYMLRHKYPTSLQIHDAGSVFGKSTGTFYLSKTINKLLIILQI